MAYIAARCGNSNSRIDAILSRFHTPLPLFLNDVYPRVRDVMVHDVHTLHSEATCAEALGLFDRFAHRLVPVIDSKKQLVGTISSAQLAHAFIPQIAEPKRMRQISSSLTAIAQTLHAKTLFPGTHPARIEKLFVRIGAMDVTSFGRLTQAEGIPPEQSIIVVGGRHDIQAKSINLGVRLLVITGNRTVDEDTIEAARDHGVALLVSSYDTTTTVWLIRTASAIFSLIDHEFGSINPDTKLSAARKKISALSAAAFLVLGENSRLQGILSKSDILKPIPTKLVLVDHNELTQAVPGADEVAVTEILDHHRLAPIATPQPILFINDPVGSTCTIVAELFRRHGFKPTPDLAGLMMSGLISDTLLLQSPTSTSKDADILSWLESHADIKTKALANLIFTSGSVILVKPPENVIHTDFKIYEDEGIRFSVSQVEELGFANFWSESKALLSALATLRDEERLAFAALLVTDINTQNSLMLVKGDTDIISRISYTYVERNEIFDLPGVVSRKKQLIPYLTSLLREGGSKT